MKRVVFILLWTVAFFIMGQLIFAGISAVAILFIHRPPNVASKILMFSLIGIGWLFFLGFPIVGLISGIREKLPGTREDQTNSEDDHVD